MLQPAADISPSMLTGEPPRVEHAGMSPVNGAVLF
jgi:hypothetical protein